MKRVCAYIVLVLELLTVNGRGLDLTDLPDYESRKDIKINSNCEKSILDIDEDDLLVNKFSDGESDLPRQQYFNDDHLYFGDTPSGVAHGSKDKKQNSKSVSYIAFLTFASAAFIGLATLFAVRKNIIDEFGITPDINDNILSTVFSNHSQQSGHASQSLLPNDRLFAHSSNVESDYDNSFKKNDMNESDFLEYIARMEAEECKFYRNVEELKIERSKARRDREKIFEIDFLIKQNNYGFVVKDAEIAEAKYLYDKKVNGEFDGEFMTTDREIYSDTLERKQSKLYENLSNRDGSDEPEIMAVTNMNLLMLDDASKQTLIDLYESEEQGKEFYRNTHKMKSNEALLLAHLKVLSPQLPVDNPNEFYIEFGNVSDSFTGELEEQRVYKIEKLYGIGSTAVILGGRPIDKYNQPVGEPLALKIVYDKVRSDMGDVEKYLNRITTGEELLLAAGAAKQKQLGLPVNAQSATERTGILFPVKSMSLTTKPGYIVTRKEGNIIVIHPQVYAYPAMPLSFDSALVYYGLDEREPVIDYFAKSLILNAAHMHSMGLVHLDEKEDNVLIGPGGRIYLCDFSFVRPIGDMFEEEKMMNGIFLDPEGLIESNSISLATEAIDSWRIGLSILNSADTIEYTGKPFDQSSIDFHSISGLSKTLVEIVSDLTKPLRNHRLTPGQIIEKYPEFFGISKNENKFIVPEQKHA